MFEIDVYTRNAQDDWELVESEFEEAENVAEVVERLLMDYTDEVVKIEVTQQV